MSARLEPRARTDNTPRVNYHEGMDPIWDYARVPDMPHVYVCGCFERWVSIYLQAVRGLNLSWALVESGRAKRVAVIGGGFAGLAAAAGLGHKGVEVTLFEQNRELLQTQRNNRVRSIHPHIHEWPRPGSLEVRAGLPLLEWHAGLSADMATEVLRQFAAEVERSPIRVITGAKPITLNGNAVTWNGGTEAFDAIILALGVGVEKSFGNLPLKSYWSDDSIATIGPYKRHLVTGVGEGGVIDALYLRLKNFSHLEMAQRLAEIPGMKEVEAELLEIESDLEGLDDHEANGVMWQRYNLLPVPAAVDALLKQRARSDTWVTLNGPEPHALAARADILNRFLISRLLALGELKYLPGRIVDIQPGNRVIFEPTASIPFDEIEIRHGTYPALKVGFPEVWERYHPVRVKLPHLVPEPMWPAGWFD
jgi:hypothetical protein